MINTPVEEFTAEKAKRLGLIDRIKKGEALVEGYIKLQGGFPSEFYSPNFTFNDKYDVFRVGTFKTGDEFLKFCEMYDYEIANKQD